jgi:hypothetical protein
MPESTAIKAGSYTTPGGTIIICSAPARERVVARSWEAIECMIE